MDEIVRLIQTAEKKTPVKVYVRANRPLHFENCHVFTGADMVVMGDYGDIEPVLARNADAIEDMVIECDRRNSALPLLDVKLLRARIEPGAILRAGVSVGDGAVIMMGAIINIGNPENEASIKAMAEMLVEKFDKHPLRSKFPPFAGYLVVESGAFYGKGYQDVQHRVPSIKNAKRLLGWEPKIQLEESIETTLDFFLAEAIKSGEFNLD